jgi:hypothetical protein
MQGGTTNQAEVSGALAGRASAVLRGSRVSAKGREVADGGDRDGHPARRVCSAVAAFVVSGLALCLLATSAAAKLDGYTTPINLSQAGQNAGPRALAVDPQGRATPVWLVFTPPLRPLATLRIDADGNPGTADLLTDQADEPQVATDVEGRSTIVWSRIQGSNASVRAVRLDAAGNAGTFHTLSEAGEVARLPQVAVDPDGRATVVWEGWDGQQVRVRAVRLNPAGNPGPVRTLSVGAGASTTVFPQVAVDPDGRATVVWDRQAGANRRIQAVRLDAAGNPGTVRTLSQAGQDAHFPAVAVDPQGRATAVWSRLDASDNLRVQAVRLNAAGNPETTRTLSEAGVGAFVPKVAVDPQGRASVVWYMNAAGANARIQTVQLNAAGIPGTLRTISADGQNAFFPQVAVDVNGHATAVWYRFEAPNLRRVQAVRLDPAGFPGPVQTLSQPGQNAAGPLVDVDPQGRATVVWQRFDGSNERVQTARGLISLPTTSIDSGPSEGEVIDRRNVTFAFSGAPPATIASFECSLDDGPFRSCASPHEIEGLANGPHTFAVRAVDVDGDRDPAGASRSFTVNVPGPPPPPPVEDSGLPAQLVINRAQVRVPKGAAQARLVVRGSLDPRAAGERLALRFRAAGRQISVQPRVQLDGQFAVNRVLRGAQRRARAGQVRLRFGGNDVLRAVGERLRASRRAVRLRISRTAIQRDRLVVAGRVRPPARKRARIQVEFNQPNGDPAQIATRARVNRRGRFRARLVVPSAVRNLGAWVAVTHPGRARLFGQRHGRNVGG